MVANTGVIIPVSRFGTICVCQTIAQSWNHSFYKFSIQSSKKRQYLS